MPDQKCTVCGADVLIQINKNTGLCSERCRKAAARDAG